MTDAEVKLLMLRNLRNDLLRDSDWVAAKAFEGGTWFPGAPGWFAILFFIAFC